MALPYSGGVTDLAIIGAGGFGREIVDVVTSNMSAQAEGASQDFRLVGFADDGKPNLKLLDRLGLPLLGSIDDLAQDMPDTLYVIGIGDCGTRRQIDQRLTNAGLRPASVRHASAIQGPDVRLGLGHILCAGSVMTTNIEVGRHFHLNLCATVGHDCTIGDYVTVSPGVNISGGVDVGNAVLFGTNASVLPGISIGDDATIGAGSVVTDDVETGSTVVGIPARPRGR